MIKAVKSVSVYVSDQDRALAFYTQKLGFTVATDQPMGPDSRWIELRIPGAETGVVIAKPFQPENIVGAFMNMAFVADDVQKTCEGAFRPRRGVPPAAQDRAVGHQRHLQRPRRQQLRPQHQVAGTRRGGPCGPPLVS